jgi:hypothetical protein
MRSLLLLCALAALGLHAAAGAPIVGTVYVDANNNMTFKRCVSSSCPVLCLDGTHSVP